MESQTSPPSKPRTARKEPIGLRVVMTEGGRKSFVPATASDEERVNSKASVGDLVFVDFRKPRNPGFHAFAHALGKMAIENIVEFDHLDPHTALKRLQLESGCGCDVMTVQMRSIWASVIAWLRNNFGESPVTVLNLFIKNAGIKNQMVAVNIPKSISYDSMDEEEFRMVLKGLCAYMSKRYWPSMSPEELEQMVEATKDLLK